VYQVERSLHPLAALAGAAYTLYADRRARRAFLRSPSAKRLATGKAA
jgi:hypothetical protein